MTSALDERSKLEIQLQQQLEEDIARIFDESICSDLEVVCGKLKILTHSCILKARTHKFYHKLEAILHVDIGRKTFDEIYSFISDAYTECNIQKQEKDIIKYLNENDVLKTVEVQSPKTSVEELEEPEVFSTPKCTSPVEFQKVSSPSAEWNKEYYALVPIEGNILDKELIEQDVLSNAFQSIFQFQIIDHNSINTQDNQCAKPTSLLLNSSDKLKFNSKKPEQNKAVDTYSPDSLITDEPSSSSDYLSAAYAFSPGVASSSGFSQFNVGENFTKIDSITISDSGLENTATMGSITSHKEVTLTDFSLSESASNDIIINNDDGITACESVPNFEEVKQIQKLKLNSSVQNLNSNTSSGNDLRGCISMNSPLVISDVGTSSKEEKQRQNEEIVILESSSLSSETGSWESVFPSKFPGMDISEKFILNERQHAIEPDRNHVKSSEPSSETLCPSLVQKSPFKSSSCFIDAASLADEGDQSMPVENESYIITPPITILHSNTSDSCYPSQNPTKRDLSPNDWSGSNDNDDSLEQVDTKNTSPFSDLFENTFDTQDEQINKAACGANTMNVSTGLASISFTMPCSWSTPNNSIISLGIDCKVNESEESESDNTIARRDFSSHKHLNRHMKPMPIPSIGKLKDLNKGSIGQDSIIAGGGAFIEKYSSQPSSSLDNFSNEFSKRIKDNDSPIISGGASVEDHLPQHSSSYSGSPLARRKINNIPICSGAYIPEIEKKPEKPKAPSNASAWVVDMSSSPKSDLNEIKNSLHSTSKSSSSVENCKSRSSVDSDSSENTNQKFYIDLSTLSPNQINENEDSSEKKNIFSMFIGLDDKSTAVKEMPARLSSSLRKKVESTAISNVDTKPTNNSNIANDSSILFEKLESLCNDPNLSINEIINNPPSSNSQPVKKQKIINTGVSNKLVAEVIKEESTDVTTGGGLFVKLSDLDKPVLPKVDTLPVSGPVKEDSHERLSKSIDWRYPSQSNNLKSNDIICSFHSENALSLNRLFPHLKKNFSQSLPGYLSSTSKFPLPVTGDNEEHTSDGSGMSSVQSSYCQSVLENSTTEEISQPSSLISNCQSRLGQDLLRMFLQEIAPDVIVEAAGRRIKAHKCILSSRCQFFAGILSGRWVQNAGNVISLPPFSYSVVHFTLCHIYSGVSTIPENVSIVELSTLADMLGLEGLKEAIMFYLKTKYCHHFHKPCPVCTVGVLECLPLTSAYGLDELYRRCLRWITKHFYDIWPTKAFATLPSEIREKCYQEHVVNFTEDNVFQTVYGCGVTVASLQNRRWAGPVSRMCERLVSAAVQFAAPRLVDVIRGLDAESLELPRTADFALDSFIGTAFEWAPPEQACRTYAFLSERVARIREVRESGERRADDVRLDGLLAARAEDWLLLCEGALVRAATRVVVTQPFKELPLELRKRLRDLGCIVFSQLSAPTRASPRSDDHGSRSAGARTLDIDAVRASFVPYSLRPRPPTERPRSDARTSRRAAVAIPPAKRTIPPTTRVNPPAVRTTKAQEERAKYNKIKTAPPRERSADCKIRAPYEKTKPRYLEPRLPKENRAPTKQSIPKLVSTSESSRNMSPVSSRAHTSRDDLAGPSAEHPSTGSLTESQNSNKYATYTKTKHTVKASVECSSVQPVKCHVRPVSSKAKATKIPVYDYHKKSDVASKVTVKETQSQTLCGRRKIVNNVFSTSLPCNKINDHKPSGSLMNATKSSSAKMVPKIVKETHNTKCAIKQDLRNSKNTGPRSPAPKETPVMERSGTFLKDKPMFSEKATDIDIDE